MLYMERCKSPNAFQTGGNPCGKTSQHFKPQQPQTALKEKNTKSVKNFFSCFFFFSKSSGKMIPYGIEIAPFTGWFEYQSCSFAEKLKKSSWLESWITLSGWGGVFVFVFLFAARCVLHSTAHTDVVFLLRHLWRNTNTDLVKPLIAAAITLDPVHLVTKSRETGFSEEKMWFKIGQASLKVFRPFATTGHCPTTGTSGTTATPHECSWPTSQSNQVKAILQVVTALGLRQRRPVISKQKGVTSASLPPS